MHEAGILTVMRGITGEKLGYQFSGYLSENFKTELAAAGGHTHKEFNATA